MANFLNVCTKFWCYIYHKLPSHFIEEIFKLATAVVELSLDIKAFPSLQFVWRLLLSKNYKMVDLQLQRRKVGYQYQCIFHIHFQGRQNWSFHFRSISSNFKSGTQNAWHSRFLGRCKKKWYPHFHNFSKVSFSLPFFSYSI